MSIQTAAGWAGGVFLWSGALIYILKGNVSTNLIPWIIWAVAALFSAVSTLAADGFSQQTIIFGVTALIYSTVVFTQWRKCPWGVIPKWQKLALPLLFVSPIISWVLSPTVGISLQITFSWITAAAFCQTSAQGKTRESTAAWVLHGIGCMGLLAANPFTSSSWMLPGSALMVCLVCITAIRLGKRKASLFTDLPQGLPNDTADSIILSP